MGAARPRQRTHLYGERALVRREAVNGERRQILENQLQPQLNRAVSSRSQYRVPGSLIRCGTATAQNRGGGVAIGAGAKTVRGPVGICEVGMVENVEEFGSELRGQPFPELPTLGHG